MRPSVTPSPIWLAVGTQLLAAAYLQTIEWVDLFPWNNVAGGNQQERLDVVLLVVQLLIAWWFVRRQVWLMALGLASYAAWLWLQIDSWWKPYLFGTRKVGPNWLFTHTYKFLPRIGERPTPDACHVVLQLLLIAVLVTGIVAMWRERARFRRASASPAQDA